MKYSYSVLLAVFPLAVCAAPSAAATCSQAYEAGNFVDAVSAAESALQHSPGQREELLCLGRAQGARGNHAAAVEALQSAAKVSASPLDTAVDLFLLGNEQMSAKDYQSAMSAYRQSLALARGEKNPRLAWASLNQLGAAYQAAGDAAAALDHYQQGLALAANDNERGDSYARIAAAQSLLGNHDKAIEYQIKAVLMEERSGDLDHYAHANIELGRICLAAGEYRDAEKWLNRFIEVIVLNDNPYWEAQARHLMGKLKNAQGNHAAAAEQFEKSRTLAEKAGNEHLLKEITQAATATSPM